MADNNEKLPTIGACAEFLAAYALTEDMSGDDQTILLAAAEILFENAPDDESGDEDGNDDSDDFETDSDSLVL